MLSPPLFTSPLHPAVSHIAEFSIFANKVMETHGMWLPLGGRQRADLQRDWVGRVDFAAFLGELKK